MHAEPAIVRGGRHAMLCAALGLALMFSGIWLGDAETLSAAGLPFGTLVMRVFSVASYALFLAVALWYAKRDDGDLRRLFAVSCAVGVLCFAAGAALVLFAAPGVEDADARTALLLCALFLTKMVGAPVSVGLTCVFALLDRMSVMRACALGMLGAFASYSLASQLVREGSLLESGAMALAGLLLVGSTVCCMIGLGGRAGTAFRMRSASPRIPAAFAMSGVVKRPLGKVLTPGFVVVVVFSALMLGFLRNGASEADPHANLASFVVLAALVVVAALWRGLRSEHVFFGALLCTVAGILLEPALDVFLPGLALLVGGLGTALFEVVMWSLVVWAARNSEQTLEAAALARFVAVCGHLLGTLVALGARVLLPSLAPFEAMHAAELVVVFAYVVLLIVLLKFPQLQVPFMTAAMPAVEPEAPSFAEGERAEMSVEDAERRYWTDPCDAIARTYQLTPREREVLELLARGRDMPFMEEALVVSRNTVKMHIRHIYTKLDVHSKQDLIDMVEEIRE